MSGSKNRTVAVLGASDNPERYAYKAVERLREKGFPVIPVNPKLKELLGLPVIPSLGEIRTPVDTLSLYLSPERAILLTGDILALKPGRVVLNPGTESPDLEKALDDAGIPWLHACTLVLLATDQF
jgi:predicted CoA-binding protein